MSWPKGKPNPYASERMRRYHANQERPAPKPSKSLAFLSADERRDYDNLRRYGCTREQAIAAILKDKAA